MRSGVELAKPTEGTSKIIERLGSHMTGTHYPFVGGGRSTRGVPIAETGNSVDDGYGVYWRFFKDSGSCTMETGVKSRFPSALPFSLEGGAEVGSLTVRDSRLNAVESL